MEKEERNNLAIRAFSFLMRKTISERFAFPGGGIARGSVAKTLDKLEYHSKGELSRERIIDYCICQVYAISRFDAVYLHRWKVNHSFGKKGMGRFIANTKQKRYFEDKWLKGYSLSRVKLLEEFRDRKDHPLLKFVYPDYEDVTKARMHNSEVGFYICKIATLLYTPYSDYCQTCKNKERCIEDIRKRYPELHRLRTEEYKKDSGV